jgi:hypothetical protein
MAERKSTDTRPSLDEVLAQVRQRRQAQEKSYRERALKLFPWVCARCGREFSGKRLRELTVHHKDHNHDYNPPDGSNWELLCIYCHDNEHSHYLEEGWNDDPTAASGAADPYGALHRPFAGLEHLLKKKEMP